MVSSKKLKAIKDPKHLPVVHVEWVDAASTHSWTSRDVASKGHGLAKCQTVGFLIHRSRERLSVAQSINEWDSTSETWSIPMACIKRVKVLT